MLQSSEHYESTITRHANCERVTTRCLRTKVNAGHETVSRNLGALATVGAPNVLTNERPIYVRCDLVNAYVPNAHHWTAQNDHRPVVAYAEDGTLLGAVMPYKVR